ncbi:nucleoside triphosphate pyrophosphatase [Herminiimonas sp. CN]|uniref:Maf family protein n=1 Tax=Herminiimonas sp. CN TaxID=1349818 RepID=UPI000473FA3D|nr:Maf family protein [Herminiimonas sp. CN]
MKLPERKIYLASKSPRRRELLRQIGVEFEILQLRDHTARGPDVSEAVRPDELPHEYVARVCGEKASFAWQMIQKRRLPSRPVLAADTTVVIDGKILGKPACTAEAIEMMRQLSGRTHQVMTSIALHHNAQSWQLTQISEVTFADLSESTIDRYCATHEPYDKAGGYGIQGLAAVFIRHISGSYSGIMGLPLFETTQLLQEAGIRPL